MPAHAAGLGPVAVQSRLGQPLLVTIPLRDVAGNHITADCVSAAVSSAGGARLTPVPAILQDGAAVSIRLATRESVSEPVLDLSVSVGCNLSVQRNYRILVDPELAAAVEPPRAGSAAAPAASVASIAAAPKQPAAGPQPLPAPAAEPAPSTPAVQAPVQPGPGQHNILKLSADVNPADQPRTDLPLRMSSMLSQPSAEIDLQKLAMLQEEQRRLAALLRDEDPASGAEAGLKTALAKIAAAEAEVARLKRQNQADLAAAEAERRKMYPGTWITVLLLALAALAAASATLMRRIAAIRKEQRIDAWSRAVAAEPGMTDGADRGLPADDDADREAPSAAEVREEDDAAYAQAAAAAVAEGNTPGAPFRYSARGVMPDAGADGEAHRLKVEEISDAMQLAEAWMSFHHPYKMLEILAPFKDVEQPESPIPWLCLLDVHRVMGDREKYEAIQKRIKKIYNVKMPPWETTVGEEPLKTLADFPHIVDRIFDLWDSDLIVPYLDGLLHDQRDGEREGFDLPVYRNILQLISLASDPDPRRRRNHMTHGKAYDILFCPIVPMTGPGSAGVVEHEPATPELREEIPSSHDDTHRPPAAAGAQEAGTQETGIPAAQAAPAATVATVAQHAGNFGGDDEMSDVAIKLHLAVAYQDIGDDEGARILIDEVIKHGNPEQVLKARLLLTKLN